MTAPTPAAPTTGRERVTVDAGALRDAEGEYTYGCIDMDAIGRCGRCAGCRDSEAIDALMATATPLPAERAGMAEAEANALLWVFRDYVYSRGREEASSGVIVDVSDEETAIYRTLRAALISTPPTPAGADRAAVEAAIRRLVTATSLATSARRDGDESTRHYEEGVEAAAHAALLVLVFPATPPAPADNARDAGEVGA